MGSIAQMMSESRFMCVDDYTGEGKVPELSEPIIDGILRRGHIMMLTGPPKAGKSWAMANLAYAVAKGITWLGFQCNQGSVVYVDTELDRNSLFNRFEKVRFALGLESSDRNIMVLSLRGESIDSKTLVEEIKNAFPDEAPALVVIDSIYSIESGDENNAGDMRDMMRDLGTLAGGGSAVVFAHHHAKGNAGDRNVIDRGSGSGVFGRYVDAMLDLMPLELSEDAEIAFMQQFPFNDRAVPMRLNFVLREFADPGAREVAFDFPLIVPIDGLEDSPEKGTKEAGRILGTRRTRQKYDEARKRKDDAVQVAYDQCVCEGVRPTPSNVFDRLKAEFFDENKKPSWTTFRNWLTPTNNSAWCHDEGGNIRRASRQTS